MKLYGLNVKKNHGPAMVLITHVATPSSTSSERPTTTLAREGYVCMCTAVPDGTGVGAVYVERGGQKTWPKQMSNHTKKQTYK